MSYVHLDLSQYPMLILELNGAVNEVQIQEYLDEMAGVLERREHFSMVVDLSHASIPSLKVRSLLRKFAEENAKVSDEWTVSSALVIHNGAIKMAVSAIYSFVRTAYPKKVFRSRDDAVVWTQTQLENAGAC